jgi:hypothetical protein
MAVAATVLLPIFDGLFSGMFAKAEAVKAASSRVEVEAGPRLTVLVAWWASGCAGEALLVADLRRNTPHSAKRRFSGTGVTKSDFTGLEDAGAARIANHSSRNKHELSTRLRLTMKARVR